MNDLAKKDLEYIWHPCSQMKDYEELAPIVVDHGKGVYLYDIDGKKYNTHCSIRWCDGLKIELLQYFTENEMIFFKKNV